MWSTLYFVIFASVAVGQRPIRQDNANGWDIRLAVPGEPGSDYPTLGNIPRTTFSCAGKTPGYYADTETNCQVFRICTLGSTYGFQSFLCPNGTLFNQAVFVCDWWMNVNCDSIQTFPNTEKFGNLRLGPQLMSDVKKMLTHPMRNPYDKSAMKSNLIVMQEYKPPSGQLAFPSAQIQGPKTTPENVYVPAKLQQQQNYNSFNRVRDNLVAGSTPGPQYAPPQSDAEVFQRQSGQYNVQQNGQYVHDNSGKYVHDRPNNQNFVQQPSSRLTAPSRQYVQSNVIQTPQQIGQYRQNTFQVTQPASGNINSNGQAGRLTQGTQFNNNNGLVPSTQQGNYQYNQPISTQNYNSQVNQRPSAQYSTNFLPALPLNNGKRTELGISYSKQQLNSNQEKQPYNYNAPQFSSDITGQVGNDAKQNLVSQTTPTVITKTLTFNRIVQAPKPGAPKSRITFKTWIVKPSSKSAKLIAEPTPYSYNRPTSPPPSEKIILEPTPYYYNKPTTTAQTAKLVSELGYTYSRPTTTQTAKLVAETGYSYEKPTVAAKQVEIIRKTPQPFVAPTTIASTLPSRQYLAPSPATLPARQYLAPTTFKPAVRLYLPPSEKPPELARQYLGPTPTRSDEGQSARLVASPSTPTPVFAAPNRNDKSLFSLIKHSRINTNHNNLTFTDILTKEKLDITVNDIVKDTSKILGTASPQSGQLRQEEKPDEYPDEAYLPPTTSAESAEILTTNPSTAGPSKSAKLIAKPSVDLVPPESSEFSPEVQNTNRLAQLPFFKEPTIPTNTIERTVSLKISIPEKTAAYLFKTCNDSDFDKLEILNTGSSNYLVLTNKVAKNTIPSFIPIGKLIVDKSSNISDSQALVFSFLADSINQVKEYNTIAEQNLHSTSAAQSHFQSVNNEELAQITDKVARLTAAQYATSQLNNANIQTTSLVQPNRLQTAAKYTNQYNNNAQFNASPQTQQNVESGQYHSRYQTNSNNIRSNENQIYSGQLYQIPVPDVSGIYSGQSSAKLITPSNVRQHTELADLQQHRPNQNVNAVNTNNLAKQSSAEVEIVQSQSLPPTPLASPAAPATPAKLQAAPFQQSFNSQEDTLIGNFVPDANGISAQLRDKIVGTIAHPSEENKLVTYKKDQSYYVYTKFDHGNNIVENFQSNQVSNSNGQQSAKLTQSSNADNGLSFQFVPSVSYQLEDEKEQQRILNAFNIDEFGSPKGGAQNIVSSNSGYTVQQQQQRQQQGQNQQVQSQQYNAPNNLYMGPSSYSAPQASVGRLETNGNYNSAAKIEQFDENSGYSKAAPSRSFSF